MYTFFINIDIMNTYITCLTVYNNKTLQIYHF